ncbi:MAG: glycosyltransferase family 2 protein [Bacteroidales bacterium]
MRIETLLILLTNLLLMALALWTAYSAIYFFIFSISGIFYREPVGRNREKHRFALLIPGYKEDNVIVEVARQALQQSYPSALFDVFVIADSFHPATLLRLRELPVKVIEVSFEKSTKVKSLNKALEQLDTSYDLVVILDADNVMEHRFLEKVNSRFTTDVVALQTHRVAKNLDTPLALLDAISEEVNNHVFRKGHRVLGLSAALIGSGMVFRFPMIRNELARLKAIGGFDKELEMNLLQQGIKIHYMNDTLVFDEKVSHSDTFSGQRRRWLSAQFIYFGRYFRSAVTSLFRFGNIDFFDKLAQMALMPRILLLGITLTGSCIALIAGLLPAASHWTEQLWITGQLWHLLTLLTFTGFIAAIPRRFYNQQLLSALLYLPKGFVLMLSSLLKIKGANRQFIHTQHGQPQTMQK